MLDATAFPVLTTERLTLQELRRSDAVDVLMFRGDPIVQKYDDPVIYTEMEARAFIEELHDEYLGRRGINWAVTWSGLDRVVGIFSLHHWDQYHAGQKQATDWHAPTGVKGLGPKLSLRLCALASDSSISIASTRGRLPTTMNPSGCWSGWAFSAKGTFRRHSWEDDGAFHDSAMYGLLRENSHSRPGPARISAPDQSGLNTDGQAATRQT